MFFFSKLREKNVLGMNARSLDFILPLNPRSKFAVVDDKILTKEFMQKHNIPSPTTYGIITGQNEISKFLESVESKKSFVIKPASGSAGKGITIITDHDCKNFTTANGNVLPLSELHYRISNILTGLYSRNGYSDDVIIEYKINQSKKLERISYKGIADLRMIIHQGEIAMAMLRLPTIASDGKANLHQGGIGVGINLETGITESGSLKRKFIEKHPDNEANIIGFKIPNWKKCIQIALDFQKECGLGYVGVDIALDEKLGPLVLEGNARPGLEIQLANKKGLLAALKK